MVVGCVIDLGGSTCEEYTDHGQDYYEQRYSQRVLLSLAKRAEQLGMKVVAIEQPI